MKRVLNIAEQIRQLLLKNTIMSLKQLRSELQDRPRSSLFRDLKTKAQPLLAAVAEIAETHGRTSAQVALNWLLHQPGILPIPGARDGTQAMENAGAIMFRITEVEWNRLEELSRPWLPR